MICQNIEQKVYIRLFQKLVSKAGKLSPRFAEGQVSKKGKPRRNAENFLGRFLLGEVSAGIS